MYDHHSVRPFGYDWGGAEMKLSKSAKSLLSALAPLVGSTLGGPLGGVAGNFLAQKLGVPEEEVNALIESGSPDVAVKLAEADKDFDAEMARLNVDLEKIHADDRSSARDMGKATSLVPQIVLTAIFVVLMFYILYRLIDPEVVIAEVVRDTVFLIIGALLAEFRGMMQFWFGSSQGSKMKTK